MMRVEVLNWAKFNPRKDVQSSSWFRLAHDLFENHEFFDFSHAEIVSWIYILSVASKKNSASVHINLSHVEKIGRIKKRDFHIAVEKLKQIRCIDVDYTGVSAATRRRDEYVSDAGATNERTNERNERTILTDSPLRAEVRRVFDFEILYQRYPRKEGKQKGMAACKAQIRSQEDYDSLSRAVDRYAEHLKKTATDPKFIKHFSTFMASWRDWCDPSTGTTVVVVTEEPAWVKEARAEEEMARKKNAV